MWSLWHSLWSRLFIISYENLRHKIKSLQFLKDIFGAEFEVFLRLYLIL